MAHALGTAARRLMVALTVATSVLIASASVVAAAPPQKVLICHAAGRSPEFGGPTQYVLIEVSLNALYAPGGHFDEPGTPNAGHEDDFITTCDCDGGGGEDPGG